MGIKLLFIIGLVLLYLILKNNGKEIYYFYLTIIMLSIRELNVPYLGDITPATIMIDTMLIGMFPRLNLFRQDNITFLITLMIGLILGLVNVPDIERMLNWSLLIFNVVVLSSIATVFITNTVEWQIFLKCIVITCLIFSFTTIVGYLGLGDGTVIYNGRMSLSGNIDVLHSSRIYGISPSNLVQTISVITICLIPSLNISKKFFEYLIIGIIVFSALITLKRMTFIALVFSICYYIRCQLKTGNYTTLFIISAMTAILIYIWWEPIVHRFGIAGFGESGKITDHSTQSRFDRIGYAIAAFRESPLFGMGSGYVTFVHNGFFEILGNCGILGTFTIFLKFIPKITHIVARNPWAVSTAIYVITCFSLESAINHAQIIYFLGLFLGGYQISKELDFEYNYNFNYPTEYERL